jgi:predicted glycosyltransferase
MAERLDDTRILIYSHDTFGLGHLRRCRAIAHSLVARFKGLSVLILSGSPIIGSFDFKARVDFIRLPGVIKLKDGAYTSLGLHIDLEQTMSIRESIIYHTAATFKPDIFLVDKEPTGLKKEVVRTLRMLRGTGAINILGLRDVMDDASALKAEWEEKQVQPVLETLYHDIFVYGPKEMGNPISSLGLPESVLNKIFYTGYLDRELPSDGNWIVPVCLDSPYILVTTGGGGDGADLIDWVVSAYEVDPNIPYRAVIVSGPFMQPVIQQEFHHRCEAIDKIEIITFDTHIELLMKQAAGIVSMGGYNTFCEILWLDKPALIIPRSIPRLEQTIRANRAAKLGLITVLDDSHGRDPKLMADALYQLPGRNLPSVNAKPGLLDGHENIARLVRERLELPETFENEEPELAYLR